MREGAGWIVKSATALGWSRAEPLCLTGGLGPHYARFLDADVVAPRANALEGALALAADIKADAP
jgi:glucosamine kinase